MKRPTLTAFFLALALFVPLFASAQGSDETATADISGTWILDVEKSYAKADRSKVSSYTLKISQAGDAIRLVWDYTIEGRRSFYSEILFANGSAIKYPRTGNGPFFEPTHEFTKWKKGKLVRTFIYGAGSLMNRAYKDRQEFTLNKAGDQLTVVTIIVNRLNPLFPQRESGPMPPTGVRGRLPVLNSPTSDRTLVFRRMP